MRKSTLSFCEKHVTLDGKPFRRDDWPLMIDMIQTLDYRRKITAVFLGNIQSIKTLAATLVAAVALVRRPSRFAWYSKTGDSVKEWADERLNPFLIENPVVSRPLRVDLKVKKPVAGGIGFLNLFGAHTKISRQSKTFEQVVCDEPWTYDAGELTEIQGRYTAYANSYQLILPTSGPTKGGEVDGIIKSGEWRLWHVPCDSCGGPMDYDFFVPKPVPLAERVGDCGEVKEVDGVELWQPWGGLHFRTGDEVRDDDGEVIPEKLAQCLYYECPMCGHRHHDNPAKQELRNKKALEAWPEHSGYRIVKPGDREVVVWNWNCLAFMGWVDVARLWLRAIDARTVGDNTLFEDFYRKRVPHPRRPWTARYTIDTARKVSNILDYELKELWPEAARTYLSIDWQKDHFWYVVRAFAPDVRSRLIAYGKVVSDQQLRDIQLKYEISDHGGYWGEHPEEPRYVMFQPCRVGIDGNYKPAEARRLAALYHWLVLRGDDHGGKEFRDHRGIGQIYGPIRAMETFEGTAISDARFDRYVPELVFANDPARNRLASMRDIQTPNGPLWGYPRSVGQEYLDHLGAWVREIRERARDNQEYWAWSREAKRDDLFWCEKAIIVLAAFDGLIGVHAREPSAAVPKKDEDA